MNILRKYQELITKYPNAIFQIMLVIGVTLFIIILGKFNLELFHSVFKKLNVFVFNYFGSFYLVFALFCCFALFVILLSPIGNIRLGGPDAKKEHSNFSWLTMIFCTGMGVGFMFWGAAEPLYHFMNPPYSGVEKYQESFDLAFSYTFLHWGFETWALYGMFTISLGYWLMNLKNNSSFSSFINVKNEKFKFIEKIPDSFTVLAVVFGIATTIGLGTLQVEGGFERIFNLESGFTTKILAVVLITTIYLCSIYLGLEKGLKVLSNVSVIISLVLLFLIFFLNVPLETLKDLFSAMIIHFKNFFSMSMGLGDFNDEDWVNIWTVKTWSWVITWTPFVGAFIAGISKGRTFREIIIGVVLVPSFFSFFWFIVFGKAAIDLQVSQQIFGAELNLSKVGSLLFTLLNNLPLGNILSMLSLLVIVIFISNSADSASISIMNFNEDKVAKEHKKAFHLSWGLVFAILSISLVLVGGLKLLHEITQIAALPFTLMLCYIYLVVSCSIVQSLKANEIDEIKL